MGNRAITVNYKPDGDDWQVTVTEGDRKKQGTAAGLIAARDLADQLVAKIDPDEDGHVVHLLDGDAFAFTSAYLHARHGLPPADTTEPSASTTSDAGHPAANTADQPTDNQLPVLGAKNGTPVKAASGTATSDKAASDKAASANAASEHPAATETRSATSKDTDTGTAISATATVPGSKMITLPKSSVRLAAPIPAPAQSPDQDKEQHPV